MPGILVCVGIVATQLWRCRHHCFEQVRCLGYVCFAIFVREDHGDSRLLMLTRLLCRRRMIHGDCPDQNQNLAYFSVLSRPCCIVQLAFAFRLYILCQYRCVTRASHVPMYIHHEHTRDGDQLSLGFAASTLSSSAMCFGPRIAFSTPGHRGGHFPQ